MKKANIIISAILIAFCSFFAFLTARLPQRNLPNTLGIDFMPWTLFIILFSLSLILLLKSVFTKSKPKQGQGITVREVGGVIFLTLLVYLYVRVMSYAGFLMTTPLFIAVLMLSSGARKWKGIVAVSVLATVGIYFFFQKVFQVQLPGGLIF
ncbi:MAG: tripartite tricarboxylate transporter TctB family protein [Deltaproteobacteria bacterium]|nr:tripartite tricarboxylate transporter TctB family protein [Deltaproteobacteria bacterium]MBW1919893.1 tripartite tricarboxylate transporter TctB family protein [Deltaproteobacteria bacterium]MBW1934225.1 tripartite tricarboxylate transporter TctB family protein [Deltaproteobacteria bacterium]MBW1976476.1 tripartite tricarboxylate transporter TctB family protein [Deltaproteobacteria bacterium]MBW2044235.1 tripartite tricarboxylate transporter TctB family protein [Deltaproteobacteria bacterium